MILGITGGIATGKSTVARMLAARGAVVVNADDLAREVMAPGSEILQRLTREFGPGILHTDGGLNRRALGDIVFRDGNARRLLNAITHPAIGKLAVRRIQEWQAKGASLIVYESPLLFEAGAEHRVDKVLVVITSRKEQWRRLLKRPGMTPKRAAAMIDSHMNQEQKAARGDFVLETSGTLEELEKQVETLLAKLKAEERSG